MMSKGSTFFKNKNIKKLEISNKNNRFPKILQMLHHTFVIFEISVFQFLLFSDITILELCFLLQIYVFDLQFFKKKNKNFLIYHTINPKYLETVGLQ